MLASDGCGANVTLRDLLQLKEKSASTRVLMPTRGSSFGCMFAEGDSMTFPRVSKAPWLLRLSAAVAVAAMLHAGVAQAASSPVVSDTGSLVFAPYYTI